MQPTEECEFQLKAVGGGPLGEASNLAIRSGGYPDEEAARATGQQVKDALLLASVTTRLGANMGRDQPTGGAGRELKKKILETQGVDLRSNVHGLDVFPENHDVRFVRAEGKGVAAMAATKVTDEFVKYYQHATAMTDYHRLAAELINLVHFETFPRARFLTLMTALEVLSERRRRPPAFQNAISELIQHVEDQQFEPEVVEMLRSGLGNLRRQSIKSACVEKVTECLDEEVGSKVSRMYDTRSQIVHQGAGISADELSNDVSQLRQIVADALIADLKSQEKRDA